MSRQAPKWWYEPGARVPLWARALAPLYAGAVALRRQLYRAGLLRTHRLAEGVWGQLRLEAGRAVFVWEDGSGEREDLAAPAELVVPPLVPHYLEVEGDFSIALTFHR